MSWESDGRLGRVNICCLEMEVSSLGMIVSEQLVQLCLDSDLFFVREEYYVSSAIENNLVTRKQVLIWLSVKFKIRVFSRE